MSLVMCHACDSRVPGYDVTRFGSIDGGYRDLCSRCYNEEVARLNELDFSHIAFEPVEMSDAAGTRHRLHFLVRHLGDRVSLEAFELRNGTRAGHEFQILGAADADLFELLRRLVERMRRTFATQYLVESDLGLLIADMEVRGRVDCDLETIPAMPMLVIDGRDVSWEEFGRMVMTFEGWQFGLAFKDRSEEL
jgi:hypothetical protein